MSDSSKAVTVKMDMRPAYHQALGALETIEVAWGNVARLISNLDRSDMPVNDITHRLDQLGRKLRQVVHSKPGM